ncbi:DUF3622 domain-containing protein [Ferrimonas gelatinilytica]|uniref:DUF3622 domain-containing protein n=1 Tax=Ferrimonas gelatinilytica TaxID=1255257 RepID=A0ABP9S7V7_9GAMM
MAQSKKYDYRVTEKGGVWSAAIIRRVTARRTAVSKKQGKFATEAEAIAWAEAELKTFLASQSERNKRKAESRIEREAAALRQAEKAERKAAERAAKREPNPEAVDDEFDFSDFGDD